MGYLESNADAFASVSSGVIAFACLPVPGVPFLLSSALVTLVLFLFLKDAQFDLTLGFLHQWIYLLGIVFTLIFMSDFSCCSFREIFPDSLPPF